MTNKSPTINPKELLQELLKIYDKVMYLKIYINNPLCDEENETQINNNNLTNYITELENIYYNAVEKHNKKLSDDPYFIDAGFDIFTPKSLLDDGSTKCYYPSIKIDFKIKCSTKIYSSDDKSYNTGYYMYTRSSISKTNLRLANSVGIIDSGYRGNLIGMFDVFKKSTSGLLTIKNIVEPDYVVQKYDRLLQLCAPILCPIVVELVNDIDELGSETERGNNGIGSTGR